MEVTVIPVVVGTFGTVPKSLGRGLEELEIGDAAETIPTTALFSQNTEESPGN